MPEYLPTEPPSEHVTWKSGRIGTRERQNRRRSPSIRQITRWASFDCRKWSLTSSGSLKYPVGSISMTPCRSSIEFDAGQRQINR